MRLNRREWNSAAGLLFLFLLMASMLAFYNVAVRVRQKIYSDRLTFLELLGDWYSFKAELVVHAASGENDVSGLIGRLARIDYLMARVTDAPIQQSLRILKFSTMEDPAVFIESWMTARLGAGDFLDLPVGTADHADYEAFLRNSAAFEERAALWIRGLDGPAKKVRKSVAVLQFFFVFAAIATAAAGAWFAVAALKSRRVEGLLRDLMRSTYRAQEAERKRMSLELHDTVAQELAAAGMYASCLPSDPAGHLESLQAALKRSIRDVRDISWRLRPPELERSGFSDAAAEYCRRFEEPCGPAVRWIVAADVPRALADETAINLYRVLQEALMNIRKHAGASHIEVSFRREAGSLILQVQDDGVGFDPGSFVSGPDHRGIAGMRERAALLGGSLAVVSGPGIGTEIRMEVPLER